MSDIAPKTGVTWGVLAEYENPATIFHACEQVRDAGYTRWDSHTPFAVHGLDGAMGLQRSKLPYFVLVAGLTGAGLAMLLQWWVATQAQPVIIAGKPLFSWQAFIPVTFEVGVLFAALTCVFGILGFSKLPRFHNPLFRSHRFERATDDRFFIAIETADPKFNLEATQSFLRETGAVAVEVIED